MRHHPYLSILWWELSCVCRGGKVETLERRSGHSGAREREDKRGFRGRKEFLS